MAKSRKSAKLQKQEIQNRKQEKKFWTVSIGVAAILLVILYIVFMLNN